MMRQTMAAGEQTYSIRDVLSGAIAFFERGEHDKAGFLASAVLNVSPEQPKALFLLGMIAGAKGDDVGAVDFYTRVLSQEPENLECLARLGELFRKKQQYGESASYFVKILDIAPDNAAVRFQLARTLSDAGLLPQAAGEYLRLLKENPKDTKALLNLGWIYHNLGQHAEAREVYGRLLELEPQNAQALLNLGILYSQEEFWPEALEYYSRVLELRTDSLEALIGAGIACRRLGFYQKSLACFDKAIELDPRSVQLWNHAGAVLLEMGEPSDARGCFMKALEIAPEHVESLNNLGLALHEDGETATAIKCFETALLIDPAHAESHFHRSLSLLTAGDYIEGFREYEWRDRTRWFNGTGSIESRMLWDGSPMPKGRLLIRCEQGFGDAIQFLRYVPMIRSRVGTVDCECPPALIPLLERTGWFNTLIRKGEQAPEHDREVMVMSLPGIFGTTLETIPAHIPYVHVDDAERNRGRKIVGDTNALLKVGLVWEGRYPKKKSCALEDLAPLFELHDVVFFSLQKRESPGLETAVFSRPEFWVDLSEQLKDFADTAAVLSALDVLVTVDTAAAHLAGAINRRVLLLLHQRPDWRWAEAKGRSLWYPSVEIYRQERYGIWNAPAAKVKARLEKMARNTKNRAYGPEDRQNIL